MRVLLAPLAAVALMGCVAAGPPRPGVAASPDAAPACNTPIAIALAVRNASEDSAGERRRLPC